MKYKIKICLLLLFATFKQNAQTSQERNFSFGTNCPEKEKGVVISDAHVFEESKDDYFFDYGTAGKVTFEEDAFTASSPVYFSIKLPEDNYKVTVEFGSENKDSRTTVKAESRRLMLNQVTVPKGESKTRTFIVNLRTVNEVNGQKDINIKPREEDDLNWDDKLTLEFLGEVAVKSISIEEAAGVTNIFLAGDSTVTDQDFEPWGSWGQMITRYFTQDVVIANYAASGLSLNSFKGGKRLDKILSLMKPGDYLFIEFGHNDQKEKGEGKGPWQSYTNSLIEYIQAAREKGGIPVLVTPTQRRHFKEDKNLKDTHGDYPAAMRKVGKDMDVPLIDITEITTQMYEAWGASLSRKAFVHYPANTFPGQDDELKDDTHFNSFGANEVALAVINEIRNSDLKLKEFIKPEVPVYNPEKPTDPSTWSIPSSSRFEATKPEGN
ncbi:rhamnogalacturonan acetylesterase [Salegentibacter sp. F188]|uniref:Rhamnogalacturonan acetylesterase n=1 Tax=Autumnicola patrickiae TaxID=3075591 RepID=A0ABU3E0Y3_9FLAO|nr:rhamnogalacturonan acetylesterase [Salegentibacter sp. F188]MDT0688932.1 rhamnogalacturonan acetylesterase [Salegentibacter sp. F188]